MTTSRFKMLFVQYRPHFVRFGTWLTADTDDAEDLVQDVYCHALRRCERLGEDACFRSWICTLIRSLYRHKVKEGRRERQIHAILRHQPECQLQYERYREFYAAWPHRLAVRDAIGHLPRMFRAPLVLHELQGLNCDDVSALEGQPVGTIKSRLHRGRRLLRQRLMTVALDEGLISYRRRQ